MAKDESVHPQMIKIWVDDCRIPPDGYLWIKTVNDAVAFILAHNSEEKT